MKVTVEKLPERTSPPVKDVWRRGWHIAKLKRDSREVAAGCHACRSQQLQEAQLTECPDQGRHDGTQPSLRLAAITGLHRNIADDRISVVHRYSIGTMRPNHNLQHPRK